MYLYSDGIQNGKILEKYGKRGACTDDVPTLSLPLSWDDIPSQTVSFALAFLDYDNIPDEGVCWIHWLAANIPADRRSLAEDESRSNPELLQGRNSWAAPFPPYGKSPDVTDFYGGPAPERLHKYEISLYALDCRLNLSSGFYYNELRDQIKGHILAEAVLYGTYE